MADLADLKAEIDLLKSSVQSRAAQLQQLTEQVVEPLEDSDVLKKQVKDEQDKLNEVSREQAEVERLRAELQPAYDRAIANRDQRDRAEQLRREIVESENTLASNEELVKELELQLHDVSLKYKVERERGSQFKKSATALADGIVQSAAQKIKLISELDEGEGAVDPYDILDITEEIIREREREISHVARQLRELQEIVSMKQQTEVELEKEVASRISTHTRERDEEIRELVYSFQERRAALQADIEEVKKVNQEQSINLTKGQFEQAHDANKFMRRTPRVHDSHRHTQLKKEPSASNELRMLEQRKDQLEDELRSIKERLAGGTAKRNDIIKSMKALKEKLKRDKDQQLSDLHHIASQTSAERNAAAMVERENKRLMDTIEHLYITLRCTKKHVDQLRGTHAALPIE